MFSKLFDTTLKVVINHVFIHVDAQLVHLRVAPCLIWYANAVGTFQRMGAVPKLRPSIRARIFWRTKHNFWKTIAQNENMSTKRKTWSPPVESQSSKKGRPNKSYGIKDAVKLVSGLFAIISQSLPCSVRIFRVRFIISGGRTFAFYTHFVLIIFSQVVDHRIQLDQALWACRLHNRVNIQTLHYRVQKELKLRIEQWEAANPALPRQEGMIIAIPPNEDRVVVEQEDTSGRSGASPLTETDESTERSSALTNSTATTKSTRKKRRSRRSPRQVSEARLDAKVEREDLNQRYKAAFKQATLLMSDALHDESVTLIIKRLNTKHNLIGTKKTLTRSTLYRAVSKGSHGETSPAKKGPAEKIPGVLLNVAVAHTQVSQCGDGEMRGREIKRLIGAAIVGTEYNNKFKIESVWRKMRREFPEQLQAASKVSIDDARAQWTTFDNLQQWFDDVKKDLIETGLVIDAEVRDANGVLMSELDFRSDDVRRRIINMDETHHDLSITGDRSGPRAVTYHNPSLQRGSKRGVKSSRHVTGVYATNSAGESLPPMYIFDSGAKIEDNFQVRLQWLDGLPSITGRFGCPERVECGSFYSVRSHGSMDDSLLNEYIDKVILPLYPNIAKTAAFEPTTGKLLHGPVILKVDSGPGRIVASFESIVQREALAEKGLIIISGLPNATSVQQEMDALYGAFKSATYDRGEFVLMQKMKQRGVAARTGNARVAAAAAASILTLGFEDLATIVNGHADDNVSMRPFDKHFTKEKILQAWHKIGFVPFTRRCLSDKKVRHELGQSCENKALEDLQARYDNLVSVAEQQGLNPGVFDASIPVSHRLERVQDEDAQVRQLLAQKGAFSASALWNICGTRVGNARVALRAQKEQIAINDAKILQQSQSRLDRQAKLLLNAQSALSKYKNGGNDNNALNEKDWGDIVRWVLPVAKVPGLMRDLKKSEAIIAKLNELEKDWTTYIPSPTAV